MVGIGCTVEVGRMAAGTGIGCVVVVAVVAGGTIIGDGLMCAIQYPEIVMVRELGRTPAWFGCVASGTIRREIQALVIRIGGRVPVGHMAGIALGGCADISRRMAGDTVRGRVCSGQWESGIVVIEGVVRIPCRVAGKTGRAVVGIPRYTHVVIIRFRIHVAGGTGKLHVVSWIGVAIHALIPFTQVFSTVDREVVHIMIKRSRLPSVLRVASDAIIGELQCFMVRIGRLIKVRLVAAGAGIGRIVVVAIVAGRTIVGDHGMRPI